MQFPISQAKVHCDGKWELYKELRARYNSFSRPSQMGCSKASTVISVTIPSHTSRAVKLAVAEVGHLELIFHFLSVLVVSEKKKIHGPG